jgi:prepilin-type N-terminal cleavage/methylation domain-containing protein
MTWRVSGLKLPTINNKGLTLIEIVAVLVLIAIMVAVVLNRRTYSGAADKQREVIVANMRFAQARAMSTDSVWGLNFLSNSSFVVFKNGSTGQTVCPPGGTGRQAGCAGGNNVTLTSETSDTIVEATVTYDSSIISFNRLGVPCTDQAGITFQSASPRTFDVTDTSGATRSITVQKETGLIQ